MPQALTFFQPDHAVGADVDVFQGQRRRVAQTDAVLVLRLAGRETLSAFLDDEPRRPGGGVCKHRVDVGMAAIGNPLLVAGDFVTDGLPVLLDGHGHGLERCEIASGRRFAGTVGHQQTFLGNATEPVRSLFRCASEHDRVAAKKRRQHSGGEADVDPSHRFTHPINVEGAASHSAVFLRDEHQLHTELLATDCAY